MSETESSQAGGFGWRKLQAAGATAIVLMAIYFLVVERSLFVLIFLVPVAIGLALSLALKGRVGVVWLGVVALALLAMNSRSIPTSLSAPASPTDFIPTLTLVLALITMIVAAVPAFRAGRAPTAGSPAAKGWAMAAALVLVAGVIFSFVASSQYESAIAGDDDIQIVTEDFEFVPDTIRAEGGQVSVFVANRDSATHTFTIEELDVDLVIPGNKTARTTFTAPEGKTFSFICRPHVPDMKGTLRT